MQKKYNPMKTIENSNKQTNHIKISYRKGRVKKKKKKMKLLIHCKQQKETFTFPCSLNLLKVSDSPTAGEAARAAIGANRLDWETEILQGREEKVGVLGILLSGRNLEDLNAMSIW